MKYEVILAPDAVASLEELRAFDRAHVEDAMRKILGENPTQESKSRIKRLRALEQPQYRLRVDALRIFYDVVAVQQQVHVLAIVTKEEAQAWLDREGTKS
jgi:mRNA-degrading endonuclease RelE of RelBE toxin-antitoxin system